MTLREPTLQELFPISHNQHLSRFQSTFFVNQALAKGGITGVLGDMPPNLPAQKPYTQVVLEKRVAGTYTTNYIKDNWRVIIASAVIGGIIVYTIVKINEHDRQEKLKIIKLKPSIHLMEY